MVGWKSRTRGLDERVTLLSYIPMYNYLPELAMKETRTITLCNPRGSLPATDYGLVEMYCADANCDCRRVFLMIMTPISREPLAVIAYGWESLGFYAKWAYIGDDIKKLSEEKLRDIKEIKGPCLNSTSWQSKYAPDVLRLVAEHALSDKVYVDRLKRHYRLFKKIVNERGDME